VYDDDVTVNAEEMAVEDNSANIVELTSKASLE
jgi:hypothetical protein